MKSFHSLSLFFILLIATKVQADSPEDDSEEAIFTNYVTQLQNNLNLDKSACEDFFGYACGNYDKNVSDLLELDLDDLLVVAFSNPSALSASSIHKAKDFYSSCIEEKDLKGLLDKGEFYNVFGGWPAVNEDWNEENFTWHKYVSHLLQYFGVPTVFEHVVQYKADKKIVRIYSDINHNFEDLEDILQMIGVGEGNFNATVNDIKLVSDAISDFYPSTREHHIRNKTEIYYDKLNDHQESLSNIIPYLEDYFGVDRNEGVVIHLEYAWGLEKLSELLSTTKRKSVANYLMWLSVKSFMKKKRCDNIVFQHFAPVLISSTFDSYYDSNDQKKRELLSKYFHDSFQIVKDKFPNNVENFINNYENLAQEVLSYKSKYFNNNKIDEEYEDLEINPSEYYQNMKNINKKGPTPSQKKYFSTSKGESFIRQQLNKFLRRAIRIHQKPMLHHFIVSDYRVWRDIFMVFKFQLINDENFTQTKECFNFQALENNLLSEDSSSRESVIAATITAAAALRQAMDDYNRWVKENENEINYQDEILRNFNLSNTKAFFLSFAQNFCDKDHDSQVSLVLSLMNFNEFSKEFDCSNTTLMSPEKSCDIIW